MERDLTGRCGTCGFFMKMREVDDVGEGECRLGCWPAPLKDTATCPSHKPLGQSFAKALVRKHVVGAPRRSREEAPPPSRPTIPSQIGIDMDQEEFRQVLREVLFDELGIRDTHLGDRWQGGEVVLRPGREGTAEKVIPLDTFFQKIVMVREKLRVLEQKVNGNKTLSSPDKVQLQQYITACYGSLTTFNVLFRDKEEGFVGQRSGD